MEHFYCMDTDELEPIIKPKEVKAIDLALPYLLQFQA